MLLDGEEDAGSLAFAHHADDVISGGKLLSVHRFVDVRFGFALEQNDVEPWTGSFFAVTYSRSQ